MSSTAGGGQRSDSRLLLPHLGTFPGSPPSTPNLFLHPDSFSETNDVGGVGFQVFIVGVFLVAGWGGGAGPPGRAQGRPGMAEGKGGWGALYSRIFSSRAIWQRAQGKQKVRDAQSCPTEP